MTYNCPIFSSESINYIMLWRTQQAQTRFANFRYVHTNHKVYLYVWYYIYEYTVPSYTYVCKIYLCLRILIIFEGGGGGKGTWGKPGEVYDDEALDDNNVSYLFYTL